MSKPDRMARAVRTAGRRYWWMSEMEMDFAVAQRRKEAAYQQKRMRTIVRRQERWILDRTRKHGRVVMAKDPCGPFILAYDLLAAMKGTP